MTFSDAKQRFSNRVADYIRYRPGYPPELLPLLENWCGLRANHEIADIGSGTGLLSKVFLDFGNRVCGVEPNAEMRAAGEEFLSAYPKFTTVAGSAEATSMKSGDGGNNRSSSLPPGRSFAVFCGRKAAPSSSGTSA